MPTNIERFMDKVNPYGPYPDFSDPLVGISSLSGPCWEWTGGRDSWGYGYIWDSHEKKVYKATRWIMRYFGYEIADMHMDHLCRNVSCVNPDHLESVSPRENYLRGGNLWANRRRTGLCRNGHELSKHGRVVKRPNRKYDELVCQICTKTSRAALAKQRKEVK